MVAFGLTGIGVAALVALAVREWFTETKGIVQQSVATGGADSLMNRNTIVFSVLSALYGLTVYGFLGLYPTFLRDVLKLTPAEVGGIMPFFGLGTLTSFFAGQLGDRFPENRPGRCVARARRLGILPVYPRLEQRNVQTDGPPRRRLRRLDRLCESRRRPHQVTPPQLRNKGSSMFISSLYTGGALGGYLMGSLVATWGWGCGWSDSNFAALVDFSNPRVRVAAG
jgi:predicted MFS family arabinose efflux permease